MMVFYFYFANAFFAGVSNKKLTHELVFNNLNVIVIEKNTNLENTVIPIARVVHLVSMDLLCDL